MISKPARGALAPRAGDLVPLNHVAGPAVGNQAVVAPGTGLGEAGLFWDGTRHHVFACEGGHTDFAPQNDLQIELLRFLKARFGHVSYERILSGPGLVNVYEFLRDRGHGKESRELAAAMTEERSGRGDFTRCARRACALAEKALDLWISVYGAEASNLALKTMATGGLFLAGGITPKILAKLQGPHSCKLFWIRDGCVRWWNRFQFRSSPTIRPDCWARHDARSAPARADARVTCMLSYFAEIRTLTTPQELFAAAAEEVVRAANEAVAERGRFTIALSGGSTPKSLFNLLATNARTTLPWDRHVLFLGR